MKIADLFARLSLRPDNGSFSAAENAIGTLKLALLGLVSIRTVQWMGGLIKDTADVASAAVEASAKLGISAEAVQELGFAASQSGSDQESLTAGLGKLALSAKNAAAGGKDSAAAFKAVGLDAKKVASGAIPLDEALATIATRFADMPGGAEKSALAVKLFSKAGVGLIPFLDAGADGIDEMRKNARNLGGVIDNETAGSLEGFGDQIDQVKFAAAGVRNALVKALLPSLQKVQEKFLTWVTENRVVIVKRLESAVRMVADAATRLWDGFTLLVTVGQTLVKHWQATLVVVGSLGIALLALRAKAIGAAIASAGAWALSMLPIIGITALIAGLILIVQDLWVGFNGGESVMMNLYNAAEKWIGDKLNSLLDRARAKVEDFFSIGGFTLDTKRIGNVASTVVGTGAMLANPVTAAATAYHYGRRAYNGLTTSTPEGANAAQLMAGRMGLSIPAPRAVSPAAPLSVVNNVTVNAPPGADANVIADMMRTVMGNAARDIARGGG